MGLWIDDNTLRVSVGLRCIASESGDPKATVYLLQRLSFAVQRGNCALIGSSLGA